MDKSFIEWMDAKVSDETKEEIMRSWERCKEYGLPEKCYYPRRVISEHELAEVKKENASLIEMSLPIMEVISAFMEGSHFIAALTDRNGLILAISGDREMAYAVETGGFKVGAEWSEWSAGSNAIGTALFLGRPIQFGGTEHYCVFAQKTACAAAPIHDTEGNIIGTIDLTGRLRHINNHTLGMTVAMAAAIENMIRISKAKEEIVLSEAYKNAIIESMSEGVVALDNKYRIKHINAAAMDMLSVDEGSIGKILEDVLGTKNQLLFSMMKEKRNWSDKEILIKSRKQDTRILISLRHLESDGGHLGTVLILDRMKRVKRIANRYSGATAKLTFKDLIGKDPVFTENIVMAKTAAKSDSSILLLGESGTGKDVFAQAIHNASDRNKGPYIAINCGAIPRELVASTLFGYVEGAFTGAKRGGSMGQFEMADGGTLFLDEIGEMPLDAQVHLLRLLENRTVTRIGDSKAIPVDVRIIAATNADIREQIENGTFREDLFYRLNVISLSLPPLRERKEDIPLLLRHIYSQLAVEVSEIPGDYEEALMAYDWPGNIRELRNIIERTVSLSPDHTLITRYLPKDFFVRKLTVQKQLTGNHGIAEMERDVLLNYMEEYDGNITKVAGKLGMARSTVYRKLKKYGMFQM